MFREQDFASNRCESTLLSASSTTVGCNWFIQPSRYMQFNDMVSYWAQLLERSYEHLGERTTLTNHHIFLRFVFSTWKSQPL